MSDGTIIGMLLGALLAFAGVALGSSVASAAQAKLTRSLYEYDDAMTGRRRDVERLLDDVDAEDIGL